MFAVSKIFWFVVNPANVLLFFAIAGIILLQIRSRRRLGMICLSLFLAMALFIAIVPLGKAVFVHLEQRFPVPASLPDDIDGIVVLGGVIDPIVSAARGEEAISGAFERILASARLAKRYPEARIVFTGGSGKLFEQEFKEADFVGRIYAELGVSKDRLVFENESRNTFENAVLTKRLINPPADQTWLLVTSAFHMPRSVGVFRKAGWPVLPYPVDHAFGPDVDLFLGFNFIGGLNWLNRALHESVGLAAYFVMGRTSALYPKPAP